MKLIIDVPKQIYQNAKEDLLCGSELIVNAIKNGTPLEQEPKADGECISRQAVIQHICEDKLCYKENCKGNIYKRCPDTMWVYDLPSINPQEPKAESEGEE